MRAGARAPKENPLQPPDIYLLVTPDPNRDERYAVELVELGRAAIAVEAESLEPIIALHRHLARSLDTGPDARLPIMIASSDRYALTTLRDGFGLDARGRWSGWSLLRRPCDWRRRAPGPRGCHHGIPLPAGCAWCRGSVMIGDPGLTTKGGT